jgi:hypothetical protein
MSRPPNHARIHHNNNKIRNVTSVDAPRRKLENGGIAGIASRFGEGVEVHTVEVFSMSCDLLLYKLCDTSVSTAPTKQAHSKERRTARTQRPSCYTSLCTITRVCSNSLSQNGYVYTVRYICACTNTYHYSVEPLESSWAISA